MLFDHCQARDRVATCLRDCVSPQRYAPVADFAVAACACPVPASFEEAIRAEYRPVTLGFAWGGPWSTIWLRMQAPVPANAGWDELFAVIDTRSEACVWFDGVPYQGLNPHHRHVPLIPSFARDGVVEVLVEAVANGLFGLEGFKPLYPGEPLGRLIEARLVRRQDAVDALYHDLTFALGLVDELAADHPRRTRLLFALNAAVNTLDPHAVVATAPLARACLADVLAASANASAGHCHAVGHAHIDTAWLWPIRETRRKCYRTFSTVLRNMERYPAYRFQQGQAQLYALMEEDHPALFEQIRARVAEGRWDAGGGSWVEPDCNLISGESMVRQILHAARYWREKFGVEQRYLWLPDTFGYGAALPQILRQAGIRTFFTQKMSWNQFNRFPHHTFWWVGLDGSRVLAHFLTADTYNADGSPKELRRSERAFKQSDRCRHWLYAYGYGDGGGGPTTEMLEALTRAADCEEVPRVHPATVVEFQDAIHGETGDLPAWDGELYLERHRGTLTTHAANKRANRRGELGLRDVEALYALVPGEALTYPRAALDACWKTLLLNQFHDILPGSSIAEVYADSARDYARVEARLDELITPALRVWARAVDTSGCAAPLAAVNTLGWARNAVATLPETELTATPVAASEAPAGQIGVDLDDEPVRLGYFEKVPALGGRAFDAARVGDLPAGCGPVQVDARRLENDFVRVELDDAGRWTALFDKRAERGLLCADRPANQLMVYEDRPTQWDAWDIDLSYLETGRLVAEPADMTVVEAGPLRGSLRIVRSLGRGSTLRQYVRLACHSARLDCATVIDWQEDQQLLRTLFPVELRSSRATYQMQFGHVERPTHFNTSWDWARFEGCGHHWCDLSEPDYGVALLSDCKYGYSCHGGVLGLSLLRATRFPDPSADRGVHRFTYSILPHAGGVATGGVVRAGYDLNVPLRILATDRHAASGAEHADLHMDCPNLVIDTVKRGETDERLIVRLYEAHGCRGTASLRWPTAWGSAEMINLLETGPALVPGNVAVCEPGQVRWAYRPFGLYTFAIGRA